MITQIPFGQLRKGIEVKMDFYKSELLKMGYFKSPDGSQLYELTLTELEQVYEKEKARRRAL
ncbi:Fur-regulated basic protein FbpA (plasmid) [Cytobacillus spongiae]|uniref:Fur-regulated basic protein FbpA n=1 Tax=Cytobacillus spongiae TaxID=2901381 RepID=UPI001F460FE4|nr:Fur-regulated basic protein FbpA [Cytobacillus spongiae]UII58103.1 Fur-regulated basic protein FbpA [Cytobacillus spongiae]